MYPVKNMNDFDASGFLTAMFDQPPASSAAEAAPAPEPGRVHPGAGRPVDLGDLPPADGEWDSLPSPEPCRTCGGIACSWDCWRERHCERCEPRGQRSRDMADRAARLRARQ